MTFNQLAKRRYSCRKYAPKPVEKERLFEILEAGRVAPSAVNYQPWYFVVIDEENMLTNIRACYHREWFASASCVIVLCGDHHQAWKRQDGKDHCNIDVTIAADHMTLAATDLGLATCWVCNFNAKKASEVLKLPAHVEPIVMLPLGYPEDKADENRHLEQRKPFDEIVRFNRYNG